MSNRTLRSLQRRAFLTLLGAAGSSAAVASALPASRWAVVLDALERQGGTAATGDEAFWRAIREAYVTDPALIDLDNANVAPTPAPVVEAFIRRINELKRAPSATMLDMYADVSSAKVRPRLAALLGTTPEELGLLRNATDALNTVLRGFPMRSGDEILVTSHEYPDMIEIARQRAAREGIRITTVAVASAAEDPGVLVDRVRRAITPRTKLLLISHVSAWSGEILPVQAVCAEARRRGVATIVDAAQSVGVLDVSVRDIGCDFLAASLHKWLAAPIGTGVLAIRGEWRERIQPLTPSAIAWEHPMGRFEWNGTALEAGWASAGEAIDFQERIGLARKRDRLRRLGEYWQKKLARVPRVTILTPADPARSFGVAAFALEGVPSDKLAHYLRVTKGINTQSKSGPHSPFANAIRVSPGVYATLDELDRFADAVTEVSRRGLPS